MPRRFLAFKPRTYGNLRSLARRGTYMTMRETTTGNGGLDRMRGGGRDGRGNLRENREDPAPTVGIAIQIAPKCRRLHARTMPPRMPPTYGTLWFLKRRGTPRRYALRERGLRD